MRKNNYKIYLLLLLSCAFAGCSDLRFGDSFLDKAPGVDVTVDTIFLPKCMLTGR